MRFSFPAFIALAAVVAVGGQAAATTLYGPSAYASQADAPFHAGDFNTYFYLEDVEDGLINTPGLSVTGSNVCIAGSECFVDTGLTDSVGNGGNGFVGRSIYNNGLTTITFDAGLLGGLPTFAGLVWTDGNNPIQFQAFDADGNLLGTLNGDHADATFYATLADDRFYGASHAGGISRLTIINPPGTEIDHIQYGLNRAAVPEPSTWATMVIGFMLLGRVLRRRGGIAAA